MNTRANIVLIHGAWAEGSCWGGVIERLQASGYQVTAPQFPLTALAGDVAPAAPGARSPRRSRIEVGTTDVMEVTWQRPPVSRRGRSARMMMSSVSSRVCSERENQENEQR